MNRDILVKLAENYPYRNKHFAGPYVLRNPGGRAAERWLVACDARIILWLRLGVGEEAGLPEPPDPVVKVELLGLFQPTEGPRLPVSVQALREFVGKGEWKETCPACKGTSKNSDFVSCSFCDDDGVVSPDCRHGWIADVPINLNLVACALDAFDADAKIFLQKETLKHGESLWLLHEKTRAGIMAVSLDRMPDEAPRFLSSAASGDGCDKPVLVPRRTETKK